MSEVDVAVEVSGPPSAELQDSVEDIMGAGGCGDESSNSSCSSSFAPDEYVDLSELDIVSGC